jgi:hypothetical protein
MEGLGSGQDFLGAISRIPRKRQKPLVRYWSSTSSYSRLPVYDGGGVIPGAFLMLTSREVSSPPVRL